MKCLENISRINYPKELVYNLTELYTYRGKDFYYEDVFKSHMNGIVRNTIIKDTIFAGKILGLNVTEARMKYIAKKDSEPKTKDEMVVSNLKKVFTIIQEKGTEFEITSNEILRLAELTFKGATSIGYKLDTEEIHTTLLTETKTKSRRDLMDEELRLYIKALEDLHIEATQVATDLYVDMLNMEYFKSFNEYIALLTLYCLLFRERFNVFKYVSFFEKYYERKDQFNSATAAANYGWKDGYSQTAVLNNMIIDLMLEGYDFIESQVQSHEFDKNIRKVDSVEGTIMKLDRIFTKDQIKVACPTLSDSTINRALKKLKDEHKIAPNGTGRSATWVKLVEDEILVKGSKGQLSLFDLLGTNADD